MEPLSQTDKQQIHDRIVAIKTEIEQHQYQEGFRQITQAMAAYPDAAWPHNLLGILLEHQGRHSLALRHFRAAADLEPGYQPAEENLDHYSKVFSPHAPDYGDEQPQEHPAGKYTTRSVDGINYVVRSDQK